MIDLENYMFSRGVTREEFTEEMNKHLRSYVCPPGNHPHALTNRVLELQVSFMIHELRNTWERQYMNFIDFPESKTGVSGARAYAELFCALALRPGDGGPTNTVEDPGVQNAIRASLWPNRTSFSALSIRRDRAETVYRFFLANSR